ncbi:hypothetical protein [Streptomyces sp. AC495_CC817]|uniref:DsrE family protein n=1 Tax=Streptomyces sp. AC495_CC817 TaxID=2823900 RepID=UPI001C27B3A8|nr:hypothetical protein [Streptomyces sp. AC495_CC817]
MSDHAGDITRALGIAGILHGERPATRIRIIVNGPAVPGLTADARPLDITGIATVEACEGGMRAHGVTADQLQPGVITVPSAAVALSDEQFDGAAYIRV